MPDLELKYGCNPHQGRARLRLPEPVPLRVLNGTPSYINVLDALTAWPLVRELRSTTGKIAAASFKHLSPAGVAIDGPISEMFSRSQFLGSVPRSPVARAYVRARGGDRMSSFGDAVAVSDPVDRELSEVLKREVSDLIVAPAYEPDALEILRSKKRGAYVILEIDSDFEPGSMESRQMFGLTLEQQRNDLIITADMFRSGGDVPYEVAESLVVATTALKYTQSNSVAVAYDGQVIGIGAGQQSRIHCTRIACAKAEKWMLQTHPKVMSLRFPATTGRPEKANAVDQFILWNQLSRPERQQLMSTLGYEPDPLLPGERRDWFTRFEGLSMSSDAFIPFRDNIDRAAVTGVAYVAHTGGSARSDSIREAARTSGITLIETGIRCFLH